MDAKNPFLSDITLPPSGSPSESKDAHCLSSIRILVEVSHRFDTVMSNFSCCHRRDHLRALADWNDKKKTA